MKGKRETHPLWKKNKKKIKSHELGSDTWWGDDHPTPPNPTHLLLLLLLLPRSYSLSLCLRVQPQVMPPTVVKLHGACCRDLKQPRSRLRGAAMETHSCPPQWTARTKEEGFTQSPFSHLLWQWRLVLDSLQPVEHFGTQIVKFRHWKN